MFEKEAEEYAEKKICQEYTDGCMGFYKCKEDCERYHNTQKYWKDGAEFGYNKAKEEMQEQGLALQSDMDKTIEQNIALKKQIEKMKCCGNCAHLCECGIRGYEECKNFDKWELREIKENVR